MLDTTTIGKASSVNASSLHPEQSLPAVARGHCGEAEERSDDAAGDDAAAGRVSSHDAGLHARHSLWTW